MKGLILVLFALCTPGLYASAWEIPPDSTGNAGYRKFKIRYQLGTEYSIVPKTTGMYRFYGGPELFYPVSERFSLSTGVLVNRYLGYPGVGSSDLQAPGLTSLGFYGSAAYSLSPDLLLFGTGTRHQILTPGYKGFFPQSYNEFEAGAVYRLGKNVRFGASVRFTSPNNYFAYPPLFFGE